MNVKFLSLMIVLGLMSAQAAACAPITPCYKNVASFMAAEFGERYKKDKTLVVTERKYGSQTFTEVADEAGGTNVPITLLRKNGKQGLCVALTSFPVTGLKVTRTGKAGKPLELTGRDQASGDQPSNEITYALTKSNTFEPTRCKTIRYNEANAEVATEVACPALMKELGLETAH